MVCAVHVKGGSGGRARGNAQVGSKSRRSPGYVYVVYQPQQKTQRKENQGKEKTWSIFITCDPPLHGLGSHASVGAFLLPFCYPACAGK